VAQSLGLALPPPLLQLELLLLPHAAPVLHPQGTCRDIWPLGGTWARLPAWLLPPPPLLPPLLLLLLLPGQVLLWCCAGPVTTCKELQWLLQILKAAAITAPVCLRFWREWWVRADAFQHIILLLEGRLWVKELRRGGY
jgi:hypothetical protein